MSESPNLIPIQEKHAGGGCGCGEHDSDRLTLDARPIPHVGEGFDLLAPHVPTPLLTQIDQLPFTFKHTLLEAEDGFARVEILRVA